MVRRADNGAEGGGDVACRLGLAPLEEGNADALAAIGFFQHGFAKIEDAGDVDSGVEERLFHGLGFRRQGQAGGGADNPPLVIARYNDGRTRRIGIDAQIVLLVGNVAIVKIGEVAEDLDAQPGEIGQERRCRRPYVGFDLNGPLPVAMRQP